MERSSFLIPTKRWVEGSPPSTSYKDNIVLPTRSKQQWPHRETPNRDFAAPVACLTASWPEKPAGPENVDCLLLILMPEPVSRRFVYTRREHVSPSIVFFQFQSNSVSDLHETFIIETDILFHSVRTPSVQALWEKAYLSVESRISPLAEMRWEDRWSLLLPTKASTFCSLQRVENRELSPSPSHEEMSRGFSPFNISQGQY